MKEGRHKSGYHAAPLMGMSKVDKNHCDDRNQQSGRIGGNVGNTDCSCSLSCTAYLTICELLSKYDRLSFLKLNIDDKHNEERKKPFYQC